MNDLVRAARQAARRPGHRSGFLLPAILAALIAFSGLAGWVMLETPAFAVAPPNFSICRAPPYKNCVIDGDTFYLGSDAIRIADIDAPETHPARCPYEAELGTRATHRLREILNARPFELRPYARDQDVYGRKLRIIAQDGASVGGMLVTEGLARPWTGKRAPWCVS